MFTVKETAAIFKVTKQTVYNWIKSGKLETVRICGNIRITEEEIERKKRGE